MPQVKTEESPIVSREDCEVLLRTHSIDAFRAHKLIDKDIYNAEIDSLAKVSANILTIYHDKPQKIIDSMETALKEYHEKELENINYQIKQLLNIRKQVPSDTSFGEQQFIKITTQINNLEQCKAMSMKETMQEIIIGSLDRAIKIYDAEIPVNFNPKLYEYASCNQD